MYKQKNKFSPVVFFAIIIFGAVLCGTNHTNAFGVYESGSSVIKSDWQLYIDGTQIDNIQEKITIRTDKPTIFGYTVNNVKINLLLSQVSQGAYVQPIETITDSNGYWIYVIETAIPAGDYSLSYTLTDSTGAATPSELAASFEVPETLPSRQSIRSIINIPATSLNQLNYLTGPLIVFGIVVMLTISYILIKYIISHE